MLCSSSFFCPRATGTAAGALGLATGADTTVSGFEVNAAGLMGMGGGMGGAEAAGGAAGIVFAAALKPNPETFLGGEEGGLSSSKFGLGCNTMRLVTATCGLRSLEPPVSACLVDDRPIPEQEEAADCPGGAGPQKSAGGHGRDPEEPLAACWWVLPAAADTVRAAAGEGPPVRNFHLHSSTQSTKDSACA